MALFFLAGFFALALGDELGFFADDLRLERFLADDLGEAGTLGEVR